MLSLSAAFTTHPRPNQAALLVRMPRSWRPAGDLLAMLAQALAVAERAR